MNVLLLCQLSHTINMVNAAVIKDQNTTRPRIRVHEEKEVLDPCKKLVPIVAAFSDVAVDDSFDSEGRKD